MGITITNFWKLFCFGVKRDHYDKLIGIREFLERLAFNCFNNTFSTDTGIPEKNIPLLDEIDDGETVSTCRSIHFSSTVYHSTHISTMSDLTLNSASYSASTLTVYTLGSHNSSEKEVSKEGLRYTGTVRGYCNGRLCNRRI